MTWNFEFSMSLEKMTFFDLKKNKKGIAVGKKDFFKRQKMSRKLLELVQKMEKWKIKKNGKWEMRKLKKDYKKNENGAWIAWSEFAGPKLDENMCV